VSNTGSTLAAPSALTGGNAFSVSYVGNNPNPNGNNPNPNGKNPNPNGNNPNPNGNNPNPNGNSSSPNPNGKNPNPNGKNPNPNGNSSSPNPNGNNPNPNGNNPNPPTPPPTPAVTATAPGAGNLPGRHQPPSLRRLTRRPVFSPKLRRSARPPWRLQSKHCRQASGGRTAVRGCLAHRGRNRSASGVRSARVG
jgi:hypothetical protein